MIETSPSSSDKTAAMLTHLGGIFFSVVPSLIVYLAVSNNAWLKDQARNALNFQLTMLIAWVVVGLLHWVLIGFLLVWPLELANVILCIVAAIKANQGEPFRYPAAIELVKT
ncbi:MAG TPA: DUF4870 domain-containing protein [Verrucomicrobiae bacterium]|nr:DUF4870 domain-containing protein [Verrucomicrobiae bacterium]